MTMARVSTVMALGALIALTAYGGGNDANAQAVSPAQVSAVQGVLRHSGDYHGAIDGREGGATVSALRRWQHAHNLRPTGIIDPATLRAMRIQ